MKKPALLKLVCVIVTCVALARSPQPAFAQRGGHGGGGGFHGGGFHRGGSFPLGAGRRLFFGGGSLCCVPGRGGHRRAWRRRGVSPGGRGSGRGGGLGRL